MRKLKRFLLVILVLILAFAGYVQIVNRNSTNMTRRQKVLKAVYPAWMWITRLTGTNTKTMENKNTEPLISFYTLKGELISGSVFDFTQLIGKKVLLVNTASDCGYTDQYEQLQQLQERYKNRLVVVGFPANDFKEQEKGTNEEIAQFCKVNYGVRFPLMAKSIVLKNEKQNPVFQWLTDSAKNGWNKQQPSWNFSKYLVNEQGALTNYFDPSVSPLSEQILSAIEK